MIYTYIGECYIMLPNEEGTCTIITQYGSTVYIGMAMGGSALWPYIRKFQFSLSISIQSVF